MKSGSCSNHSSGAEKNKRLPFYHGMPLKKEGQNPADPSTERRFSASSIHESRYSLISPTRMDWHLSRAEKAA